MRIMLLVLIFVVVIVILAMCATFVIRIMDLDTEVTELERRVEDLTEAGKVLNREILELDSRGRMRDMIEATKSTLSGSSYVTQEQVGDAKKRAKL